MILVGDAGQDEKIAAADGLNILFQRLAVQATLNGEKSLFEVVLIADK